MIHEYCRRKYTCYVKLTLLLAWEVKKGPRKLSSIACKSTNVMQIYLHLHTAPLGAPNVYAQMCCIYTCTTRFARSANLALLGQLDFVSPLGASKV